MSAEHFSSLSLSQAQLKNLESLDYKKMTPVQAASLPHALENKDLIVQAKTGSGKTAAKLITLCGGTPLRPQADSLEHGAHIVVGTPGRIQDHLSRETLDLSSLDSLVLDEADRMLDMGFYDEIMHIVRNAPKDRQTLLFSATYPDTIKKMCRSKRLYWEC